MTRSREFNEIRSQSQPADLLEAFYAGILERTPDSAGASDYLREVSRGRHAEAIMNLISQGNSRSASPRGRPTTGASAGMTVASR